MSNDQGLIVDVGMHKGDDTAFYLAKGYRVLAIEADPELVSLARHRFVEPLSTGRLTIAHCAIAGKSGSIGFFSSSREGWGSISPLRAGAATGAQLKRVEVPAATFAEVMNAHAVGPAYYVKIDIEGADAQCVESMCSMEDVPPFMSFEVDLGLPDVSEHLIDLLASSGYRQFALVNQSLNPERRCCRPAREGRYVDARFTHEMSGPFGREVVEPWGFPEDMKHRIATVARQQRLRGAVGSGRIAGLPVGYLHRPIRAGYNLRPVKAFRLAYSRIRRREVGGWFDVHARLE